MIRLTPRRKEARGGAYLGGGIAADYRLLADGDVRGGGRVDPTTILMRLPAARNATRARHEKGEGWVRANPSASQAIHRVTRRHRGPVPSPAQAEVVRRRGAWV